MPSAPAATGLTGTVTPPPATVPTVSLPSNVATGQIAPGPSASSLCQSDTIQGNVLAGFRKDHEVFAFLKFPDDLVRARGWLGELVPRLAATREVAAFNARFSAARRQNGGDDPESFTSKWVNVGLTAAGLQHFDSDKVATDLASNRQNLTSFLAGAAASADQLGDTGDSDPSHWLVGGTGQPVPDAILTVAADDPDDLLVEMEKLRALGTKYGLVTLFEQRGNTLPGESAGHEHFGFKDGVSQPGVAGFDAPASDPGRAGEAAGSPGTKLVAPGEFVLGHPREGGASPWTPPDWMADGSFQVWRRLEQDVPGFWAQATAQAASFTSDDPPMEDWLAAKLMGRWRSGTPLDAAPDEDNRSARDPDADNDFNFTGQAADGSPVPAGIPPAGDVSGLRCPLDAHVRKMNPRNGSEAQHRIIRRGIPFGLPFDPASGRGHGVDADRGLLFVAFMASIENQFEFLQSAWANTGFPGGGAGPDPVIGAPATTPPPTHRIQRSGQPPIDLTLRRFVRTTGSLYAFAPSLPTLKALADGSL